MEKRAFPNPDLRDEIAALRDRLSALEDERTLRRETERELKTRLRQQAAITDLGALALNGEDIDQLMEATVFSLAEDLGVEYSKILELQPDGETLLLKHGVGWGAGQVGHTTVDAGERSQAGYTLLSNHPVIVVDLPSETRFSGPDLLTSHSVVSGVSVIIQGTHGPYGILGAHTRQRRLFTEDDVHFLQALANVVADAISRKETVDELRRQSQILDQIHDAVVATDLEGYVTSWNHGAENMFGYSKEEVIGRHVSFVYGEDDPDFLQQKVIHPLLKKGDHKIEVRMYRKSGRPFYAHLSLSLLHDAQGELRGMIGYSTDISERKLMAIQIHELGRAVGSLSSAIEALREGAWQDAALRDELLSGMEAETQHTARLLDDLATIDARSSGTLRVDRETLEPAKWFSRILAPWREIAGQERLRWKTDIPADLPPLHADPDRLNQVLENLISNAIKYTPPGGEVRVACGVEADEFWIRVSDTGVGVPFEEQEHIFMPFYRPDGASGHSHGMGLGLTIARDLVKAHGGRVSVESIPGEGSTFTVWLPLEGIPTPHDGRIGDEAGFLDASPAGTA
jgi:two-component system cell cycle sensor histidine kinase/response regulator CckA